MKPEINFKKLLKKVMTHELSNSPRTAHYPSKPGVCGMSQEEIDYLRSLQTKIQQKVKEPVRVGKEKKAAKATAGNELTPVSTDFGSPASDNPSPACPTAE